MEQTYTELNEDQLKTTLKSITEDTQLKNDQVTEDFEKLKQLIGAYVEEQLLNIKQLSLNLEKEKTSLQIDIILLSKKLNYIVNIPWYKNITKKQKDNINLTLDIIQKEVYNTYEPYLIAIDKQIKMNTKENLRKEVNKNMKKQGEN